MASLPLISAPFAISATFGSTASDVQLALLANGAMVAVWQSYGGPSDVWYDVRAQALNHDATLSGGNFQVNTEPSPGRWSSAYYQAAPDVTAMPDGGYVIAYIDGRGTIGSADGVTERPVQFSQVVAQRFNADDQKVGTDGTLTVGLTAGGSPWYPVGLQVQSFGSSNFALAFDSNEFLNRTTANQDFNSGVYISGYSSTNAASQAAGGDVYSFRTVNTLRSGIQSGVLLEPQLDASGQHNGRMVALWRTTEFLADGFPYGDQLHAHILSEAGTPIGAEITIPRLARTDFSTRRGDEPYDLATLPGGGFVVVWTQRPGDNDYQAGIRDDIVFQMVNADGSLNGTVQRVHAADSRAQASPTIAAQPDGHFLIGWSEYDGSTYTLRGQLYTPNGTKDGDAFNLAPGASGTLANPQSLATSTGSYLVGYEDDGAIMGVTVDPSATPAAIPIVTVTTSGMTANGPVLTEGNDGFRPFTFTLTFDRAPTTEIRINYALGSDLGVYANNPNYDPIEADDIRWDFGGYTNSQQSGSLILDPSQFSPGQTSFDFPLLSIRGDTLAEADEFLQLRISSPDPTKAIVLGGEASLTVRIANDDSQTPIGVGLRGPSTVTEGTGDYTDYLAYEVHLDRAAAIDTIFSITGNFRPTPSPWFVSDRDFVGDAWPQWQVTIPAGQTVGTFYVSFKPDDIPELNERAIFALIDFPVGYRTGIPAEGLSAILATDIQDDDTPATPAVATTGPDFLVGTSAPDTFIAGAGNDTVSSGQGIDAVFGDEGNDFLSGGPDNDILDGGSENDVMAGGEGIDTLSFSGIATNVTLNLGTKATQKIHTNRQLILNSVTGLENVIGGAGNDTLTGNIHSNVLVGNAGADKLFGLQGRDILIGGLGADVLLGSSGEDILIAGRTTNDVLVGNLLSLQTKWVSGIAINTRIDHLRAGTGSPQVSLKAKVNVLNDSGADDRLTGGADLDWYFRAIDDVITDLASGERIDVL